MRPSNAQTYVTKAAAAQRQLDSAIRMYLIEEDRLAIHTVGAAAFRIIRDLKEKRGRGTLHEAVAYGVFAFASDWVSGKVKVVPPELCGVAERLIEEVAEGIRSGRLKSAEDLILSSAKIAEKSHWAKFNIPANFLKHSDFDDAKALLETEIENEMLLVQACVAYKSLFGNWTAEMFVLGQLWNAESNDDPNMTPNKLCVALRGMSRKARRKWCLSFIKKQRQNGRPFSF